MSHHFPRLWMERELRSRPQHFEPELLLLPLLCDKSKIAIDVGTNMGIYSYCMAKYSKTVVGFEPNQDLWPSIRRLVGSRITLERFALSDKAGDATLRLDPANTGVATIEVTNIMTCVSDHAQVIDRSVETRTLDSFNYSPVSMIKIDVEGHEEAVVNGAQMTIVNNQPILLIESEHRHNPGAPLRLIAMLSQFGYRGFYISGNALRPISALRDEDTDPARLTLADRRYVNNFVFIPSCREGLIQDIGTLLAKE